MTKLLHLNKNGHKSQQQQRNYTFSKFTTN